MKNVIYLISLLFIFPACENPEEQPDLTVDLKKISVLQAANLDLEVTLFSDQDLFVGYNRLYIRLKNNRNGQDYTDASIRILSMMHMTSKAHSSPCEDPGACDPETGLYTGAVVFQMPSNDMEYWEMVLEIRDTGSEMKDSLVFPVTVIQPEQSRMFSFLLDDHKYFVSLVEPAAQRIGVNNFEITIHKKESMMNWPPADDFIVSIEPEMPTMGHGSPNNSNPVHTGSGHYSGKVNFTMTGYWKVHVRLVKEDFSHDNSFDITF